jgi:predicted phosphate transport protein (TIGR00153 family)
MTVLFRKTKELVSQIEEYLDTVDRGAMLFPQGLKYFFENRMDEFEQRYQDLRNLESKGDLLRRDIENKVYTYTLIPDSRGDVLGLLESTDKVLNRMSKTLLDFSIETPAISNKLHNLYLELSEASSSAVQNMVSAIRTYFRELKSVRDFINKALFFEKESDKIAEKIKRLVFQMDIDLSLKAHMRVFAYHIEMIADEAEDVCDRLAIASVKRKE